MKKIKITECPRDAMQGIKNFIPTEQKLAYLQQLLAVGFHTLDFGSFVSPKAVPQMKDTAEIASRLDLSATNTRLLAIVANLRGAKEAAAFPQIHYLGYPMSISETFQQKNTNKSIVDSLDDLANIAEVCQQHGKELVVYISMAFGNPYNDPYSPEMVAKFADVLVTLGASVISLADTVGMATPAEIHDLFAAVKGISNKVEWGVHLHASPENAVAKIEAALNAGCSRIDGAVLGYGGCPMADNDLVGNIDTGLIIDQAEGLGFVTGISRPDFEQATAMAANIFNA